MLAVCDLFITFANEFDKTERNYIDILTLKKGLELGLVNVKECDTSQVNTIIVKNNAITPLILIDGEEIVGSKQNRIINSTIIVAPKSTANIPVSCTERGRWHHTTPTFKQSQYIANFNTRLKKENARRVSENYQNVIWDSIDELEIEQSFKSPTSAMSESYDSLKKDHNEIIKQFHIEDGQTGVMVILDGEIKGFELLYNPEIYREYHEKILRSYLIDNKNNNPIFTVDKIAAEELIKNAMDSSFNQKEGNGLEKVLEFENEIGLGTLYTFEEEIIHWSYFKKQEENIDDEILVDDVENIKI